MDLFWKFGRKSVILPSNLFSFVMYRNIIEQLRSWKVKKDRKPLVLSGARQVGKTYILQEFGRQEFTNVVYVNCDSNPLMKDLFVKDYDIQRILLALSALTEQEIVAGETLIILDEIQEAARGLSVLKYFYEEAPLYHVAVAGSLLGITMHKGESFPVGKVDILHIYPMTFDEFLLAKGKGKMVDMLRTQDWQVIKLLRNEFIKALREYYFVGGMPEVVADFVENNNTVTVREKQNSILFAYQKDISKHVPQSESSRINQVWHSMPAQLVKENKKFLYGVVKQGGRAKEFEIAIQWLIDAGLVYKVERVKTPKIPLKFYADASAFKLFLLDCGLLGALSEIPPESLLLKDGGMDEAKGAFTENYVLNQLLPAVNNTVFYYSNDVKLEIDFMIQQGNAVVPIEAKAGENLRSKSLSTFVAANPQCHGLRFSLSDYREQEWMTNVPLYTVYNYFLRRLL